MKKPLIIVGSVNLAIILFVFCANASSTNEAMIAAGLASLMLFLLNVFAGLILVIAGRHGSAVRSYGLSLLLTGALTLLCGFTFCSQGHLNFH